jgi:hypothetical protein
MRPQIDSESVLEHDLLLGLASKNKLHEEDRIVLGIRGVVASGPGFVKVAWFVELTR